MMSVEELTAWCKDRDACYAGVSWLASQAGTAADVYAHCPRGEWLLWLAGKAGVDSRRIVAAAAACARSVAHLNTDPRVEAAVALAEAYGRGEDVLAADAERAAAAADLAEAEAEADLAAATAAWAAARAAEAAEDAAAAWAAAALAAEAAWAAALRTGFGTAAIVRKHITWADIETAMGAKL